MTDLRARVVWGLALRVVELWTFPWPHNRPPLVEERYPATIEYLCAHDATSIVERIRHLAVLAQIHRSRAARGIVVSYEDHTVAPAPHQGAVFSTFEIGFTHT